MEAIDNARNYISSILDDDISNSMVCSIILARDAYEIGIKLLKQLIKDCEWVEQSTDCDSWYECPICGNYKTDGHRSDCELDFALRDWV